MMRFGFAVGLALLAAACSDSARSKAKDDVPGNGNPAAEDGGSDAAVFDPFAGGTEVRVPVPDEGRVFVNLASASVVTVDGDPAASRAWDLAFEGFDVFTNSGASGQGAGGVFGPLDAMVFASGELPEVPFYFQDKPGGAFLDWYAYDGTAHALYSRYHVYGVREEDRLFKVQILGYYGERAGAPIAALYKVRYAELAADGTALETHELENLDATAGGTEGSDTVPSECVELATGERTMLSVAEAQASKAWSLCFRRDRVSVNGEKGGPRGASAVDLSAADTANEALADVMKRTADGEKARFDAVTRASFDGKTFRGDRIVSGFGDAWIAASTSPVEPTFGTWVVVTADGTKKFFLGVTAFEQPTARAPGTVVLRVKPVVGAGPSTTSLPSLDRREP